MFLPGLPGFRGKLWYHCAPCPWRMRLGSLVHHLARAIMSRPSLTGRGGGQAVRRGGINITREQKTTPAAATTNNSQHTSYLHSRYLGVMCVLLLLIVFVTVSRLQSRACVAALFRIRDLCKSGKSNLGPWTRPTAVEGANAAYSEDTTVPRNPVKFEHHVVPGPGVREWERPRR